MTANEIMGTVSTGLILAAYFANTFNLIKQEGRLYFLMNTIGAAGACISSLWLHFFPFVVLEAVWTAVSVVGLVKTWRTK